jgi:hypothetical protein
VFGPKAATKPKTEEWMLDNLPKSVPGFTMLEYESSQEYTYRMDERTYNELAPFGIVARVYSNPETGELYDVVIIASRSRDSFHDPRICFTAQGMTLSSQWPDKVETKSRGTAYMTMTLMDSDTGRNNLAAFLYRGQGTFYKTTNELKLGMAKETLLFGSDLDGVFYRFIPQHKTEDQVQQREQLKKFISMYLDEASEFSKGYF